MTKSSRSTSRRKIKPPARNHTVSEAELGAVAKQYEAAASNTTKEALIERFGADRYREHPDGSWTVRLDSAAEVEQFDEMDRPRQRLEVENARQAQSAIPRATLLNQDGRSFEVDADHAEYAAATAAARGLQLRERRHYGRPSERYVATKDGLVRVR